MPHMRFPGPTQSNIGQARGSGGQSALEGSKFPLPFASLSGLNIPYMIAFRFGLLPIFVETKYMRLTPKVISGLGIKS